MVWERWKAEWVEQQWFFLLTRAIPNQNALLWGYGIFLSVVCGGFVCFCVCVVFSVGDLPTNGPVSFT